MFWENFKMEKWDADQPGSQLCKELLECSTKEAKKDVKFDLDFDWEEVGAGTALMCLIVKWRVIFQKMLGICAKTLRNLNKLIFYIDHYVFTNIYHSKHDVS